MNYQNADAASTVGGGGPVGLGGEPGMTTAADISAGPNSMVVPPPPRFAMIRPFLNMAWPSGNPAMLRLTVAQWRNFAHGFAVFEPQLAPVLAVVSVQNTPETPAIVSGLDELARGISALTDASVEVAREVEDFAATVQGTQDAIRRLVGRVSISGLFHTVKGILTGDGKDILREVARDVRTVLDNFQRQVKGVIGLLEELATLIGDAATAFQKWLRPNLVAVFGEQVGGAMADRIELRTDLGVGVVTGLIGTVTGVVALADADTWRGLANLALTVGPDPTKMPEILAEMGKTIVAWDKWSGENPGRAAGEAIFNVGSFFTPVGVLGGTTRATTSLGRAASAFGRGVDARTPGIPGTGIPGRGVEPAPSPAGRPPAQRADAGHGGERAPVEPPAHETVLDHIENTAGNLNNLGVRNREDTEEQPSN